MFHRFFIFLVFTTMAFGSQRAASVPVIIDHDGDVDDLVAITLVLRSSRVHVRAITICPADSYLEPATRATQLFLARLGVENITIAQGHTQGANPFPDAWRRDAARVLTIPALAGIHPAATNPLATEDAAHYLAKLLSGRESCTILETGPLTNIADALRLDPSIKRNIRRIYVMGGAVRVAGNVEQPGHDGSAEWNFFNQPQAAAAVVGSGVPITLVPLDATNKVPLTRRFLGQLGAQSSAGSRLAVQAWRLAANQPGTDQYYFWDTLTAAIMVDPSIATMENLRISVVTTGASQGRTREDPHGILVQVAVDARQDRVERLFLDLLGR